MAYDCRKIRDNVIAARQPLQIGPWDASPWGTRLWRRWKKFSTVTLLVEESFLSSDVSEVGPDYEAGPRDRTEGRVEKQMIISGTAPLSSFWFGNPLSLPSDKNMWFHRSLTAFGDGLYNANGQIVIRATKYEREKGSSIFTPGDTGTPSTTVDYDTETEEPSPQTTSYETDPSKPILGLGTFCRMIFAQNYHGPQYSPFPPHGLFAPEYDPDGNLGAEVYWTDAALADLAGGAFSASMIQTGATVTKPRGPNLGGIDNGDFDQYSFSRSGNFSLTFS